MLLSIIIVNYNVKAFLEQCLFSIEKSIVAAGGNNHTPSLQNEVEIIVVDNHSTDDSRSYLESKFKGIQFIWKNNNPGFAKANNEGLAVAKGSLVLFLNPDTILQEDTLQCCVRWMQEHADTGALGVKMIDGGGRFLPESKRGFPTPITAFFKLSGLIQLFPQHKKMGAYYMGHLSPHQNQEVDVLAGAFMMVRKNLLDNIGGFDEQFFMYAEDIDLSFRIQKAGFKNYYLSDTRIIHFKGESTSSGSLNYVNQFYKAMQQFVNKHLSGFGNWWFRALLYIAIWSRAALAFLKQIFSAPANTIAFIPREVCVIGSESDIPRILSILKKYNAHHLAYHKVVASTAANHLPKTADSIVLCSSQLSYKEIINHCILYGNHLPVFIHHSNSHSLVSSGSKKHRGESFYL